MLSSQVSFSFNLNLSGLQNDREKYIIRVAALKKKIDSKIKKLHGNVYTDVEKDQKIKKLYNLQKGLQESQPYTLAALEGLETYAKSGQTTVTANLDDVRNCIGYPDQNIQKFFTHITKAVNILRDCGAFTMSSNLVPMKGMALWSKIPHNIATQLAEQMNLTTLQGSLGGSLFAQLRWGTRWQALQGDPIFTQWKILSMIAANSAIDNRVAHVLLLLALHSETMLKQEELPHLIANGVTIEPDKGLESIHVHLYGLSEDLRKRPIDLVLRNELKLEAQDSEVDRYIVTTSSSGLAEIYFYKKQEKPIQLDLSRTPTSIKQLMELNQLAEQTSFSEKERLRIKLLVHGLVAKVPGHEMQPKLIKISEVIIPTNVPETPSNSPPISLDEQKEKFRQRVHDKIHLEKKRNEFYDSIQNPFYEYQKAKETFKRLTENMREKVTNELDKAYEGKTKLLFFERRRKIHENLVGAYRNIALSGAPIRSYDATRIDRNRIIWQPEAPENNIQLKHIVVTSDPNNSHMVRVFYMEGEQLKFQLFDKKEINDLSGLKLEDGKREICYYWEKAKALQDKLHINAIAHEELQLESSRAYDQYNLGCYKH